MNFSLVAAEEVTQGRDTVVLAFVAFGVWLLSLFVLYLLIKYAVLDALRINRWESERDREGRR